MAVAQGMELDPREASLLEELVLHAAREVRPSQRIAFSVRKDERDGMRHRALAGAMSLQGFDGVPGEVDSPPAPLGLRFLELVMSVDLREGALNRQYAFR